MGRVFTSQTVITPVTAFPLAGAAVDLDFANNRYYPGMGYDPSAFLACSRATSGTNLLTTSPAGASFTTFGANVLRITPGLGLLLGGARTNHLLNSGAPATQTTASLPIENYTLWVNGEGSAVASAGSASISFAAPATQGSPNQFDVTVAGTVTITVSDPLNQFQLETGAFGTSYIPTTVATATRDADDITSTGAGNAGLVDTIYRGAAGSVIAWTALLGEISGAFNQRIITTDTESFNFFTTTPGDVGGGRGGANVVATANVMSSFVSNKAGLSWNGTTLSAVLNNGPVATNAQTTSAGSTPTRVGNRADLLRPLSGYMTRLVLWNTKLADATLQGFTI